MHLAYIIAIAIVPIVLWGMYFYLKNPRRQPIVEILQIFLLGAFSIIPIFIFHKYYLVNLTERLAHALGIKAFGPALSLINLSLTALFIVAFMIIFALIHSTFLKLFFKFPWWQNFKTIYKKVYNLTPLMFFFLIFLIVEIALNLTIKIDFIYTLVGGTIVFAVLEEYFKYMINPFLVSKRLNSVGEAMVNAIHVGLAFALIENIFFFINNRELASFGVIYLYRSVFTTLVHVSSSALIGYFYGLSLFSRSILANYEIEKSQYSRFAFLQKLLGFQKKSIFQSISITQGFLLAGALHAIFNLLVFIEQLAAAAILVSIASLIVVIMMNRESTQVQYGLIGSHELPEEDFERLRMKISAMKQLKEIQTSHS